MLDHPIHNQAIERLSASRRALLHYKWTDDANFEDRLHTRLITAISGGDNAEAHAFLEKQKQQGTSKV